MHDRIHHPPSSTGSDRYTITSHLTRRHFLIGATAVGSVGALTILNSTGGEQPASTAEATPGALDRDLRVSTQGWTTDFSKHSVPLSEIRAGGPPRDGIPPIDNPSHVTIADADEWLEATEPVIALAMVGRSRSVPANASSIRLSAPCPSATLQEGYPTGRMCEAWLVSGGRTRC